MNIFTFETFAAGKEHLETNLESLLDDLLLLQLVIILVELIQPRLPVIVEDQDCFYHSPSETDKIDLTRVFFGKWTRFLLLLGQSTSTAFPVSFLLSTDPAFSFWPFSPVFQVHSYRWVGSRGQA